MSSTLTFYFSRILGNKVTTESGDTLGKLIDLIVDTSYRRPQVIAARLKSGGEEHDYDINAFTFNKKRGQYRIKATALKEIESNPDTSLQIARQILDRQLVDVNGRKVVRVNDLRLAIVPSGMFMIAVDVGMEGLLRRIGIAKPIQKILRQFGTNLPSKLIIWDEVENINVARTGIQLSKPYTKLHTLHPSDLADIIEDLDRQSQIAIFSSLDEEKAADVLEELESDAQRQVIENLTVEKAADVLEKMPADEVADILEELEEDKAEELLSEMESEASSEVRELMEYDDNEVGSFMSTDFISFSQEMTVDETINELRRLKPETDTVYYLYVLDNQERLIATVSLRDLIVSGPDTKLKEIMNKEIKFLYDTDRTKSVADMVSKYNLLAVPVVDKDMTMMGTVVIDDVVDKLME